MRKDKGYFIIEILIAIVFLSMVLLSVFSSVSFFNRRSRQSEFEAQAGYLLQESMEVAYSVLLSNPDACLSGTCHPARGNSWALVDSKESGLEAKFERWVEVARVCRSSSGKLEKSSGSGACATDPNSRLVTGIVKWEENEKEKEITADLLVLITQNEK